MQNDAEMLCSHVVRQCMTPFGVVVSEVTHRSDQAVAMVVDGRIEKGGVRNYWVDEEDGKDDDNSSAPQPGDELAFVLRRHEMKIASEVDLEMEDIEQWTHVLPGWHYASDAAVRMVFPFKRSAAAAAYGPVERQHYIWQLVPTVVRRHDTMMMPASEFGLVSMGMIF